MVSIAGTTLKILQYLGVHLTNSSADTVILHFGISDLLKDNSKSKIENLGTMLEKCHTYGIKSIFISGLVYTKRIGLLYTSF